MQKEKSSTRFYIVWAAMIALIFAAKGTGMLTTAYVSGHSMVPTYQNGDIVLGTNLAELKADSVVMAHSPTGHDVIKRIVAVPGDTVEVKGDSVIVLFLFPEPIRLGRMNISLLETIAVIPLIPEAMDLLKRTLSLESYLSTSRRENEKRNAETSFSGEPKNFASDIRLPRIAPLIPSLNTSSELRRCSLLSFCFLESGTLPSTFFNHSMRTPPILIPLSFSKVDKGGRCPR